MVMIYAAMVMHLFALMTPGPDFAIVSQSAAKYGFEKAMLAAIGVSCAILIWATAAVSGLAVLAKIKLFYLIVSVVGAYYLFWIGFQLFRSSRCTCNSDESKGSPKSNFILTGFITNISNPKAIVYFGSIFSTFISSNEKWSWNASLVAIIFIESLIWFLVVAKIFSFNRVRLFYRKNISFIEFLTGVIFMIFSLLILFDLIASFL